MNQDRLPKLGLVCITAAKTIRFRTVTRRTLFKLSESEQQLKLREIYAANIERLQQAISFCHQLQISLYRLSSALFPFSDTPLGSNVLDEFAVQLQQIGQKAQQLNIRLVLHPEQYVVLNSDRSEVIRNSINILQSYARILDLLQLPHSPWALMNIHGGKGDRAERLIKNIMQLPTNIYTRLSLENDEHTYSATAIAQICEAAKIPMVFDAHHHLVYERLASYDDPSVGEMLQLARTTWEQPEWQLVHISNGREHLHDTKHSDLITQMPLSYKNVPWIEVEAKYKEQAIALLRREWLSSIYSTQVI
jgi:UV DNA damage endonuclease